MKQTVKDLEDALREARQKIQSLETEIQSLKHIIRERDTMIERLQKELNAANQELANLRRRVAELEGKASVSISDVFLQETFDRVSAPSFLKNFPF